MVANLDFVMIFLTDKQLALLDCAAFKGGQEAVRKLLSKRLKAWKKNEKSRRLRSFTEKRATRSKIKNTCMQAIEPPPPPMYDYDLQDFDANFIR